MPITTSQLCTKVDIFTLEDMWLGGIEGRSEENGEFWRKDILISSSHFDYVYGN